MSGGVVDAGLASADLSEGNVTVKSDSGWTVVKLKLVDNSIVSESFHWTRCGDAIVPTNPSAINSWLSNYWEDVIEISADFNVQVGSHTGTNVFAAEVIYDSQVQAGASTSWYEGPGGGCTDCQVQ